MRDVNKGLQFEVDDLKQKLNDANGDIKVSTRSEWLNYIAWLRLGHKFGLGLQTWWLHCTMQKMFTLHRLGSLLPISA